MTQVKICGITNLGDALAATEAGADMLGFVFFPRSPRYIQPERAGEIVVALKQRGNPPRFVGVFVNELLERVCAIVAAIPLDMAQLHGDESPQMVRELSSLGVETPNHKAAPDQFRSQAPFRGRSLIARRFIAVRALRPRDEAEAHSLVNEYRDAVNGNVPAFIVDAYDAQRFGGTGSRADWNIAACIAREFPILLAGGLSVDNVAEAIRAVRPWGVDVSSGVERSPGLKDYDRVRQFICKAKSVD
jgi:phosphoribosylanthranilate isomerase